MVKNAIPPITAVMVTIVLLAVEYLFMKMRYTISISKYPNSAISLLWRVPSHAHLHVIPFIV